MAEQRDSALVPLWIVIAALALPAIYLAAYLWICDPSGPLEMQNDGRCERKNYRFGGQVAHVLFAPLHSVDWRCEP